MSAFLQATATFSTGYKLGCTWCCFAPLCPYSRGDALLQRHYLRTNVVLPGITGGMEGNAQS